MELATSIRESSGVVILEMSGRLCLGDDSRGLRETIRSFVAEGRPRVLLHLEKLSFIDSAGIGSLVACYATARNGGGGVKLLRPSMRVVEALTMTKLLPAFEIFDSEVEAVASFTQTASA